MKPSPLLGLALAFSLSTAAIAGAGAAAAAGAVAARPVAPPAAAIAPPMAGPPTLQARSWVLVDFPAGQLLAGSNADLRIEPASLTKLMTAYAVFSALRAGQLHMNEEVLISEHAWRAEGSRTFVQVGTRVPVDVLLKGMIVQSGNDATIALAERVGGSEPAFVQMMNGYAQRLGMHGTHFMDSSGLPSPNHYSTARDLATLARAIIRDFPEYYSLYSLREFTWNNIHQENRNGLLVSAPGVDGLKTGHTETAGYCLVASAQRSGMRLVSVVVGSPSVKVRESGSAALLEYGFNFFETVPLRKAHDAVLTPRVYKGASKYVAAVPLAAVQVTVPRGQAAAVASSATVRQPLVAPLAPDIAIGELQVTLAGRTISTVPLYPAQAVPAGGLWRRLVDTILLWF